MFWSCSVFQQINSTFHAISLCFWSHFEMCSFTKVLRGKPNFLHHQPVLFQTTLFPGSHGRAPTGCWGLEAFVWFETLSWLFRPKDTQSQCVESDSLMHSFLLSTPSLSRIICALVSILLLQNPHWVKDYSYNLSKMDWAKRKGWQ